MDPRERFEDVIEAIRVALDGRQREIWTALPAILESFDAANQTCQVQPAINALVRQQNGPAQWVQLPLLSDVPLQFAGGGGFTLTFPMQQGDEGLLILSSRCIDAWWAYGGIQNQVEYRMHDLSDGFFIPGIRSVPRALANISTTTAQLRSDDGHTFVEVAGTEVNINTTGTVNVKSTGKTTVIASEIDLVGAGGAAEGVVQGNCVCAFTGAPHAMISGTVKGTV